MTKAKVLNLFGGPGTGKSTIAAGVFYELKRRGIEAESVSEYAKEVTFDNNQTKLEDQLYITANQNRRLWRLRDQTEWIVSDSPLLLGLHYVPPTYFPQFFEKFVFEVWDHYDNVNFFLNRTVPYNENGRNQSENEAMAIDKSIRNMLLSKNISHVELDSDEKTVENIIKELRL